MGDKKSNNIKEKKMTIYAGNSVPVENDAKILQWLVDNQMDSYSKGRKNLMQSLIKELKEAFGKQNITLRLEFRSWLWVLKYKDLTFNVYTSTGKGTSIEICGLTYEEVRKGEKRDDIIDFLSMLYNIINGD